MAVSITDMELCVTEWVLWFRINFQAFRPAGRQFWLLKVSVIQATNLPAGKGGTAMSLENLNKYVYETMC